MKSIFYLLLLVTFSLIFLIPVFNLGAQTIGCNPAVELCNPIQANTFSQIMQRVADIVVLIALPIVVIMIIWAGFLFVTAQGDEKKITTAKTTLWYALIGALLVVGAKAVSLAIENFARQL